MSAVLNINGQLKTTDCCVCGLTFGMPASYYDERRKDHARFYCPAGHRQFFTGLSEAERLRKELEAAQGRIATANSRVEFYRRESEMQKRSRAAAKGQLTKIKNRIAKGVCPCCNRSFEDVARHMASKHPDYAGTEK